MDMMIISTDWHFVKFDKVSRRIQMNPSVDTWINAVNKALSPGDTWIYLGDLIDSEIDEGAAEYLSLIDKIHTTKKILLRGNNDRKPDGFYRSFFNEVGLVYVDPDTHTVLSHCPVRNRHGFVNIHGHIHHGQPEYGDAGAFWQMYGITPDTGYVNAFTWQPQPVSLADLLRRDRVADIAVAPRYSKPKEYTAHLIDAASAAFDKMCAAQTEDDCWD